MNPLNPIWEDSAGRKAFTVSIKAPHLILLCWSLSLGVWGDVGAVFDERKIKLLTVMWMKGAADICMRG